MTRAQRDPAPRLYPQLPMFFPTEYLPSVPPVFSHLPSVPPGDFLTPEDRHVERMKKMRQRLVNQGYMEPNKLSASAKPYDGSLEHAQSESVENSKVLTDSSTSDPRAKEEKSKTL